MSFAGNLKELMEERKESWTEVCADTGCNKNQLNYWDKNNTSPNAAVIERLAKHFNCSIERLVFGKEAAESLSALEPVTVEHLRPVIGNVSAGLGIIAGEDVLEYRPVPEKYANNDYFFLKVNGDSMSPKIQNGDLILVERTPTVDNGTIAVVLIDGEEGVVKKVIYDANHISLVSENKKYPVRTFSGAEVQRLRIIGHALKVEKDL